MVLSVKAHLQHGKNLTERRRFIMSSEELMSNFKEFCKRLEHIFPSLPGNVYKLYWKDEEDDDILISSDEELAVAISQAQNDLLKVFITVVSKQEESSQNNVPKLPSPVAKALSQIMHADGGCVHNKKMPEVVKPEARPVKENIQTSPPNPQPSPVMSEPQEQHKKSPPSSDEQPKRARTPHPGVICDNCDSPVTGYRYKCMECDNYDLCETCHAKDVHPNHNMWKFANPPDYTFWTFLTVNDTIRRLFGRVAGGWNPSGHHRRSRRGHGCGGWSNSRGSACPAFNSTNGTNATRSNASTGNGSNRASSTPHPQNQANDEFLRSVGETVAALLDPLGISVDVDVEHSDGRKERVNKGADESQAEQPQASSQNNTPSAPGYPPQYQNWSETVKQWYERNATLPSTPLAKIPTSTTSAEQRSVATTIPPPDSATQNTSVQVDGAGVADKPSQRSPLLASTKPPKNTSTHVQTENNSKTVPCQTIPKLLVDSATSSESKLLVDAGTSSDPPILESAGDRAPSVDAFENDWYLVNEMKKHVMEPCMMEPMDADLPSDLVPLIPPPTEMISADTAGMFPTGDPIQSQEEGIATIVQQMKSMGFNDENGWLTRMVRENGGDISVVLDKILSSIPPSMQ